MRLTCVLCLFHWGACSLCTIKHIHLLWKQWPNNEVSLHFQKAWVTVGSRVLGMEGVKCSAEINRPVCNTHYTQCAVDKERLACTCMLYKQRKIRVPNCRICNKRSNAFIEWLAQLIHIRNDPGSNITPEDPLSLLSSYGFSQSLQDNFWVS